MSENAIRYWKIRVTGDYGAGHGEIVRNIIVPAASETAAQGRSEISFRQHFPTIRVTPVFSAANILAAVERPSQDPTGTSVPQEITYPYWIVD
jgi:hypothetical protein